MHTYIQPTHVAQTLNMANILGQRRLRHRHFRPHNHIHTYIHTYIQRTHVAQTLNRANIFKDRDDSDTDISESASRNIMGSKGTAALIEEAMAQALHVSVCVCMYVCMNICIYAFVFVCV